MMDELNAFAGFAFACIAMFFVLACSFVGQNFV